MSNTKSGLAAGIEGAGDTVLQATMFNKQLQLRQRALASQIGWMRGNPRFSATSAGMPPRSGVPLMSGPDGAPTGTPTTVKGMAMPLPQEDRGSPSPDVGPTSPQGNFRSLPAVQPNENIQEPPIVPDVQPTQVADASMLPRYDFPREY